jgi:REP element-mobilizing transposase RayT
MGHYSRRLPHWDAIGQPIFVTFRLHGSLPVNRVFPPARLTNGKAFVAMDRLLDGSTTGPRYLSLPEIASLIVTALHDGESKLRHYRLHSFVVMPNHIHLLVTSFVDARRWLGSLKGSTARRANVLLGLSGTPFWQDESYDHLVRSDEEFARIRGYIENNPVSAGLAREPGEFAWSSARSQFPGSWGIGDDQTA